MIAETIRKRDLVTAWVERAGGVPQAIDELTRAFGLEPGDTMQSVEDEYFSGSLIPQSEWPALIAVLESGTKTDNERAASLAARRKSAGRERVEHYLDVFCTDKRAGRASVDDQAARGKATRNGRRELADEQDRVCALVAREFALRARDRSAALITVASAVIERYRAEKDRRGLLDYEDLIGKTLALFQKTSAAWVLYKLDLGIDHVLVDEAQDTSPEQWEIIATLVSEFVQGGARAEKKRTIFAVGDEKQSIFSFQGAPPLNFAKMRDHFRRLFEPSEVAFATEKLHYSFRSAAQVLDAVDTVFKQPQAFRGLTSEDDLDRASGAAGCRARAKWKSGSWSSPTRRTRTRQGWDAPFDTTSETSPAIKLAGRIARTVKTWTARGASPRDVLILVRQRGPVFEAVIRALKREQIEVAGADRLILTEHIAIMDLMVLGDALLLADDDLALATVLSSPLFGFSDEQLFKLAYDRKGPLRSVLRARAGEDAALCRRFRRARRTRGQGAGDGAVRVLRPRARRAARPGENSGAARRRSLRSARRIPQSGAHLRAARDAVVAGLPRLGARGAIGGQARHGNGARRSAGDDGARRQGAGGEERHPRSTRRRRGRKARTRRGCSKCRSPAPRPMPRV